MINLLSDQDATGLAADVFEEIRTSMGMVPNFFRALGAADPQWLALNWQRHKQIMGRDSALDRKTKEIVALVVSYVNHCEYCAAAHEMMAGMAGASAEEITDVKQVMELFGSFNSIADTLKVPLDNMPA